MRDPRERQRSVPAREGLRDEAAGEEVQASAAELAGRGDAEVAGAAERAKLLVRPPFLVVHAGSERRQPLAGVAVGAVESRALLLAELESGGAHAAYSSTEIDFGQKHD